MNPWIVLGMQETTDKNEIKKAYMIKVAKHNPEEDPEGFKRVREAYEAALKAVDEKEKPVTPVGLFMEEFKKIYKDFAKRITTEHWEELLKNDICTNLETEEDVNYSILDFIGQNYYMPASVFKLFSDKFGWLANQEELKKVFNPRYIDFVVENINNKIDIKYHLFDANQDKDFDRFLHLRREIGAAIDDRRLDNIDEKFTEIEGLGLNDHPDYLLEKARILSLREEKQQALDIINNVYDKYTEDYKNLTYFKYVKASILLAFDDKDKLDEAEAIYKAILEENPKYYFANLDMIDLLVKTNRQKEAYDFAVDNILAREPSNSYVGMQADRVLDMLIPIYEDKYVSDPNAENILQLAEYYQYKLKGEEAYNLLTKHNYLNNAKYFELLGTAYYDKLDFNTAITHFKKALDIEPNIRVYNILISAYVNINNKDLAMELAKEAMEKDLLIDGFDNIILARIHKTIAHIYFTNKEYDKALECIDNGLKINGNMSDLYFARADILRKKGDYVNAMADAETSALLAPYYTPIYELMGEIYVDARSYDQVEPLLARVEELKLPITAGLNYIKACALAADKKPEEAKKLLLSLKDQENLGRWATKIYIELRLVCGDVNKHSEGLTFLKEGLNKFPKDATLLREVAFYYEFMKDEKNVEKAWDAVINEIGDEESYNRKGLALLNQNKLQNALEVIETGLKALPKSFNLTLRKGYTLIRLKRYEEAVEFLKKGLEEFDKQKSWWAKDVIYEEIARTYSSKLNNAKDAITYYELSIETNPNIGYVYSDVASLYVHYSKDYEKALKYYNIAIEKSPDESWEYYVRGKLYKILGKLELAEDDFKKVISITEALEGKHHGDYRTISQAYTELNEHDLAFKAIKKGLEVEKTDGTGTGNCFCLYQAMALHYMATGDLKKSIKNIDLAINLNDSVVNNSIKQEILQKMGKDQVENFVESKEENKLEKKGFFARLFGK